MYQVNAVDLHCPSNCILASEMPTNEAVVAAPILKL